MKTSKQQKMYCVTAIDGKTVWPMAMYQTKEEAQKKVKIAQKITCGHNPRAWFMAWGVSKIENYNSPGILQKHSLLD